MDFCLAQKNLFYVFLVADVLSKRTVGIVPGKLIWRYLKRVVERVPEIQILLITQRSFYCPLLSPS